MDARRLHTQLVQRRDLRLQEADRPAQVVIGPRRQHLTRERAQVDTPRLHRRRHRAFIVEQMHLHLRIALRHLRQMRAKREHPGIAACMDKLHRA